MMNIRFAASLALATLVTVALNADTASAGRRARVAATPVSVAPAAVAPVAVVAPDCAPAAPVCNVYQPCVTYKHRGRCCCDPCTPNVKQVLLVKDPCDCCCVAEVPVCLPACCQNACIRSKCGLFGRGVVTYDYDCGVCVTFTFKRCGDVVVTYRGC